MENKRRPEFVRTTVDGGGNERYERYLMGDNKRFAAYVLAAAIGVTCAFGCLAARGCYHKLEETGVISKHEPVKQEKPKYCRTN